MIVAAVALLLIAGTAFAASPSIAPASPSVSTQPGQAASSIAPEATKAPEASEPPEASEAPDPSEAPEAADGSPSPADVTRVLGRLSGVGIKTTPGELNALASKAGLGGAIRVLAFAHASGRTPAQILAMFQGGMGWGAIKHQLNLSIGPGLGWIMGGGKP